MPLLLDTGILYAAADRDDNWHARSVSLLRRTQESLLVPVTVVPEVAYLIRSRLGTSAERQFVRAVTNRELAIESLTDADWRRSLALVETYEEIGLVDATVVAIAERLRLRTVATTDRRHFGAVRPRHCDAFTLVP